MAFWSGIPIELCIRPNISVPVGTATLVEQNGANMVWFFPSYKRPIKNFIIPIMAEVSIPLELLFIDF